jgi:hypothetical protein
MLTFTYGSYTAGGEILKMITITKTDLKLRYFIQLNNKNRLGQYLLLSVYKKYTALGICPQIWSRPTGPVFALWCIGGYKVRTGGKRRVLRRPHSECVKFSEANFDAGSFF